MPTRGLPGSQAKAAGLAILTFADSAALESAERAWAEKSIDGRRLLLSRNAFLGPDLEASAEVDGAAARGAAK